MDYEHSEMLLYQNMVMQEADMIDESLNHLNSNENQIVDRLYLLETRGEYQVFNFSDYSMISFHPVRKNN